MAKDYFEGRVAGESWIDHRRERLALVRFIVWAIVIGVVIGAALYSARAAAQTYSAKDASGNLIRITTEPCPEAPTWLNLYRAEMRYEGIDYLACWMFIAGMVIVLDSNGDATPVPLQGFEKDDPI